MFGKVTGVLILAVATTATAFADDRGYRTDWDDLRPYRPGDRRLFTEDDWRPGLEDWRTNPRPRERDPRSFDHEQRFRPRWQSGFQQDDREAFIYPQEGGGSFKHLGGGHWVEQNDTGRYRFREVNRTSEYIELWDDERGLGALLGPNMSYYRVKGGEWRPLYKGNWW